MSEDANIPETGPIGVDDVLAAIQQQNVGRARAMFDDVMQQKVTTALDAEKVKIAAHVYDNSKAVEMPEPGIVDMEAIAAAGEEAEIDDDVEADLETEVEAAFDAEVD